MPIRKASRKYSPIKDRTFANGLTFASPLSSSSSWSSFSTALSYIRFAVVCVFVCMRVCLCCYGIQWWCIHEHVLTIPCLRLDIRDMYTCMCICMHCAHLNRIWVCSHIYTHLSIHMARKSIRFWWQRQYSGFHRFIFCFIFRFFVHSKIYVSKKFNLIRCFQIEFRQKKPTTYPMETNILCGMKTVSWTKLLCITCPIFYTNTNKMHGSWYYQKDCKY